MQHDVVYEARPRSEVIRQGYLTKSPPLDGGATVFKKWQRRWVVFRCDDGNVNLQYFRGEKDVHGTPLGTVMLDDCTGVQKSMKHSHYKNIFAINTPSRDYFFSADSKHEMDEWVHVICSTVGLQSDTKRPLIKKSSTHSMGFAAAGGGHAPYNSTLPRSTSDGRLPSTEHFSGHSMSPTFSAGPGSHGLPLLPGQEAGRATLARDHQSFPTECGARLEMEVDKRHIVQSVVYVEALGYIWIAGWDQKNPSLHNIFRVGDQILAVDGKEVRTISTVQHAVECSIGMVRFTIKQTPYALDVQLQKRSLSEPLGIGIEKNKLIDIVPGGIASQCGLSLKALGVLGKPVHWIISAVNGRQVPLAGIKTDETMKRVHSAGMDVTLTLQPADFWRILKKKLKSIKNWEDYMAK
ncbi:uncharacterized protein LOC134191034 [Corticium candelabrum]|uniref:uncharacterized protein LOC134191034 n=1 Tax=Corticium candelabrum TaxID=121492 RepID=UPI002E26E321|nr:uncharacterized protein LOC134191034 [Corticium candelabrum]